MIDYVGEAKRAGARFLETPKDALLGMTLVVYQETTSKPVAYAVRTLVTGYIKHGALMRTTLTRENIRSVDSLARDLLASAIVFDDRPAIVRAGEHLARLGPWNRVGRTREEARDALLDVLLAPRRDPMMDGPDLIAIATAAAPGIARFARASHSFMGKDVKVYENGEWSALFDRLGAPGAWRLPVLSATMTWENTATHAALIRALLWMGKLPCPACGCGVREHSRDGRYMCGEFDTGLEHPAVWTYCPKMCALSKDDVLDALGVPIDPETTRRRAELAAAADEPVPF